MTEQIAEVISVGDEIISGQRLDTNTQWISQQLGEIGISVRFHSSVGDDLMDHVTALKIAIERADIIIMTGGLGPTADDLSRTAVAQAVGVELELSQPVLERIEKMFLRHGREMPVNNRLQAWFPVGSNIISNPEGTAPGIDLLVPRDDQSPARLFALPGVPVEMKQMWNGTVLPELQRLTNDDQTYHFHTLNCFGAGESTIETMLPDLVRRGRDPKVGITASAATITLRVSTRGKTKAECRDNMQPTIAMIRECLGDLVFGENDQTLPEVVLRILQHQQLTISVGEAGLAGEIGPLFSTVKEVFKGQRPIESDGDLLTAAQEIRADFGADIGLVIGPLNLDETEIAVGRSNFTVAIAGPSRSGTETYRYSGHSEWRKERAVKQVLNQLRLFLR